LDQQWLIDILLTKHILTTYMVQSKDLIGYRSLRMFSP
jgi:hypothetical protein